jgi:prepilin-type N-terminal cleavage/methylation domain-containing protein
MEELMKNQKGISLIEVLVVVAILAILAISMFGMTGLSVSDGERVGTLQKISRRGIMFPTWEGEMAMEGLSVQRGQGVWEFSVSSDSVAQVLQGSLGKRIRVTYKQRLWNWPRATSYDVVKAEAMSDAAK